MICTYCSDEHPQDYICQQTPIALAEMMRAHREYWTPETIKTAIDAAHKPTYEDRTGRVKP